QPSPFDRSREGTTRRSYRDRLRLTGAVGLSEWPTGYWRGDIDRDRDISACSHGSELSEDQGVQAVLDVPAGVPVLCVSGSLVQSSAGGISSAGHSWRTSRQ
ncbi:hypothetical protein GBAR_LOCUS30226, partial [Geodia barretti]